MLLVLRKTEVTHLLEWGRPWKRFLKLLSVANWASLQMERVKRNGKWVDTGVDIFD
jgi:hypothetical protein